MTLDQLRAFNGQKIRDGMAKEIDKIRAARTAPTQDIDPTYEFVVTRPHKAAARLRHLEKILSEQEKKRDARRKSKSPNKEAAE